MKQQYVNKLPLPRLLTELISSGKWKTPSSNLIEKIAPFLKEELEFLQTIESMESNSSIDLPEYENMFQLDSKKDERANNLPWMDTSKSVLIALNKIPGDDIAIALDYRNSIDSPRLIANNWHTMTKPIGGKWEVISDSFQEFAKDLKLI